MYYYFQPVRDHFKNNSTARDLLKTVKVSLSLYDLDVHEISMHGVNLLSRPLLPEFLANRGDMNSALQYDFSIDE